MSTETTTQDVQAVQVPAQQNNIVINTESVTLKAREIYAAMSQFGENAKPYAPGSSMAGETYFTFKCKGAMINVPPAFQEAFTARKLYSVTITGRPYDRPVADPTVAAGTTIRREQSYTYDSHMTIEDYKAAMAGESEITKLEIALGMQEDQLKEAAKKAKQVKLTPKQEEDMLAELQLLIS